MERLLASAAAPPRCVCVCVCVCVWSSGSGPRLALGVDGEACSSRSVASSRALLARGTPAPAESSTLRRCSPRHPPAHGLEASLLEEDTAEIASPAGGRRIIASQQSAAAAPRTPRRLSRRHVLQRNAERRRTAWRPSRRPPHLLSNARHLAVCARAACCRQHCCQARPFLL